MTEETNREKFFSAMDESFEAILEAIRSGNERGYRFSRHLLNQVEEGQRDLTQLGRRFARQPRDMRGVYESSVELARRAARHSADLAREWFVEASEAGQEVRRTAREVIRANRTAAQALTAAVQAAASGLASNVRTRYVARPPAGGAATRRRRARRTGARRRRAAPPQE